jgi:hypothetical protein
MIFTKDPLRPGQVSHISCDGTYLYRIETRSHSILNVDPHIRLIPAVCAGGRPLDFILGDGFGGRFLFMPVIFIQCAGHHHFSFVATIFTFTDLFDFFFVIGHSGILLLFIGVAI